MYKKLLLSALIATSFVSHAELVIRDKDQPGDGLVIYDTESGLEWLKLSYTQGTAAKNYVTNLWKRMLEGDNPNYVTSLGNDLLGWRMASKADIQILYNNIKKNNFTSVGESNQYLNSLFGIYASTGVEYCHGEWSSITYSYGPCYYTSYEEHESFISDPNFDGLWDNHPAGSGMAATFIVRGERITEPEQCSGIITEMTRQQAIEYIQHLSTQLSDPSTTVITPLNL